MTSPALLAAARIAHPSCPTQQASLEIGVGAHVGDDAARRG